ncbi:hypothetical protein SAMN05443575_3857 [Jatrophihabitans endophyticus]|uniref:Uncharacterized protein n=1 Tax=Jatrophihabitans endophyticus TaxID=1206085 RepID=A0A1M5SY46_9ACTN|nr:hypothetical protein [Jatrophihabitans endophyticus]SHH43412.1 hypothetical protein SAMN05443575_3857 [Jatrophihabitans endophyticus]
MGVLLAGSLAVGIGVQAPAASAADFCASRISGSTYYQHNFSYGGSVAATICAPGGAGNAYLYARGKYADVSKYMKLSIQTGSSTVSVDGDYYSYVYRSQPAGNHTYHAIMYDGNGHKIVDGYASDFD